jgi:hypothetical protein
MHETGGGGSGTMSVDLNDYAIIKEGEAEILMRKNEVFYNPTQVPKSYLLVVLCCLMGFSDEIFDGFCVWDGVLPCVCDGSLLVVEEMCLVAELICREINKQTNYFILRNPISLFSFKRVLNACQGVQSELKTN